MRRPLAIQWPSVPVACGLAHGLDRVSPHRRVAARTAITAALLLLAGVAGALLAHLVADPYSLGLIAACSGPCRPLAQAVTRFGEGWETLLPGGVLVLAAALAAWRRWALEERLERLAWTMGFVVLSVAGSGLVAAFLKTAFGRARPRVVAETLWSQTPFAFSAQWASFPSGHATTAGATAMVLALLFPRRARSILAAATVVALSRVAVGAHYPSDVVAGFALGMAFTLLAAALFLLRGRVFQLCGGRVVRLPVVTRPCAAAGVPGRAVSARVRPQFA